MGRETPRKFMIFCIENRMTKGSERTFKDTVTRLPPSKHFTTDTVDVLHSNIQGNYNLSSTGAIKRHFILVGGGCVCVCVGGGGGGGAGEERGGEGKNGMGRRG